MPVEIELLRPLRCTTLALRNITGSRNHNVVLLFASRAGDFAVGVTSHPMHENANPDLGPHLWFRGEGLRLAGTAHGLTFDMWGKTRDPPWSPARFTDVETLSRSDGRACTRAQQAAAAQIVREVYEGIQPDLPVLFEADAWVEAEQRLRKVEEEISRLAGERRTLEEKLRGLRPW